MGPTLLDRVGLPQVLGPSLWTSTNRLFRAQRWIKVELGPLPSWTRMPRPTIPK